MLCVSHSEYGEWAFSPITVVVQDLLNLGWIRCDICVRSENDRQTCDSGVVRLKTNRFDHGALDAVLAPNYRSVGNRLDLFESSADLMAKTRTCTGEPDCAGNRDAFATGESTARRLRHEAIVAHSRNVRVIAESQRKDGRLDAHSRRRSGYIAGT